ncbi:radical SAM family heme chaperone HemW [Bacteroidaceae bacterium HV4-6-C5C]|nr:radical SAM family heme chaperone HemW [Bacteroidaceae bacterium HV4-6-C5C]
MAGIYIHIPFCKTRCIYCDFYSTIRLKSTSEFIHALCRELEQRKNYLSGEKIETIYFGGGTPSQLSQDEFQQVFDTIGKYYDIASLEEVTLEANPDDLSLEYVHSLRQLPFNRISIGIQTFQDNTLKLLKRRHSGQEAIEAVKRCRENGFNNISIDLIYGLPGETESTWEKDLMQAVEVNVEHISAYHLTYEKGTPLYKMLQQSRVKEVDENRSIHFFSTLIDTLRKAGYEHYEISNFCKPGKESRHNTSYWKGIPYLGCGPSAHSFNGHSREWNKASLTDYLLSAETGKRLYEIEELDLYTRYNEKIITGLRTKWGISLKDIEGEFGEELASYCTKQAEKYIHNGTLKLEDSRLKLTQDGIFVSDGIMSDLLFIED